MLKNYTDAPHMQRRRPMRSLAGTHQASQGQSQMSMASSASPMIVLKHIQPPVEGGPLYNSAEKAIDEYLKSSTYMQRQQRLRETTDSLPMISDAVPYSTIKQGRSVRPTAGDEALLTIIKARPALRQRLEERNRNMTYSTILDLDHREMTQTKGTLKFKEEISGKGCL